MKSARFYSGSFIKFSVDKKLIPKAHAPKGTICLLITLSRSGFMMDYPLNQTPYIALEIINIGVLASSKYTAFNKTFLIILYTIRQYCVDDRDWIPEEKVLICTILV